jgi:hypothetical protein
LSGDVLGAVAVILLVAAGRKTARRGGWAARSPLMLLLLCATALGPVIRYITQMYEYDWWRHPTCCSVTAAYFEGNKGTATSVLETVLAIAAAGLVAVYALGIRDRVVGGATLAGWLGVALFTLLQVVTGGTYVDGLWIAVKFLAAAVLVASLVLAIVYLRGKDAAQP